MFKAMARFIANYLRLIIFAAAVLIGVQVPGMLGQYQAVVNAHLSEAKQNIFGFQQTALRYFDNDINKLITHYRQSQDPVFNSDAENIQTIVDRVEFLTAEVSSVQQHPILAVLHVGAQLDKPLFKETVDAYQWSVPLNTLALFWGLGFALIVVLLLDALLLCLRFLFFRSPVSRLAT